jgi:hypothetical protein
MRKSEEAESEGREGEEKLQRRKSVVARTGQRQERKGQGWRNAKVKTAVFPLLKFIRRGRALRSARPARINCREIFLSLTGGSHHDRGGHATAGGPSSRRRTERAVAGGHVCLPTPPTTRARPRCLKRRAGDAKPQPRLWSIKWPGPLPSKEDPRVARAPGLGKFNPRMGAGVRRSPRGPFGIKRAPQVPTPHHLTDQRLEGWLAQAPRGFADARPGALSRHPAPSY